MSASQIQTQGRIFILNAKSDCESYTDCPWQIKHLRFLEILSTNIELVLHILNHILHH